MDERAIQTTPWWAKVVPPLAVFVAAEALALLGAWRAGYPALRASTWQRWDSGHYVNIARHGYDVPRCVFRDCGDAGWFPGYPALGRALSTVGLPVDVSMLLLSRMFAFATLVLVWNGLLRRDRSPQGVAALVFAGFCPGAIYFHTVFPMSMTAFLMVAAVLLAQRERWVLAGGAAGLACAAYPAAVVLAPAIGIWLLLDRRGAPDAPRTPMAARVRPALLVGALSGASLVAVVTAMRLWTGTWRAYLHAQAQFSFHRQLAPLQWYRAVDDIWTKPVSSSIGLQVLLVGVLLAVMTVNELRLGTRGVPLLTLLGGLGLWLFTLSLGQYSLYRTDSLLVPTAVLVARLPQRLAVVVATISVVLVWGMSDLFLRSIIV